MIIIILIRTSEMLNHHLRHSVHQSADIFQVVRAFDNILLPYKFHDDMLNVSRVIVLTNRQTNRQTNVPTLLKLKTIHLAMLSLRMW